jgi:outer membrane protein TolC
MKQKVFLTNLLFLIAMCSPAAAQSKRILTLMESINIAIDKSYDAANLEQSLIGSRMQLRAAQSGLKSNAELVFSQFPNYQESERRTPIFGGGFSFDRQKFLDFQAQLFVNQPIKMTDGTLSVVGVMERFKQYDTPTLSGDIDDVVGYSPQLRLQFVQPLFTYNRLKTQFKRAELNLERTVQIYTSQQLNIVFNVTLSFYQLFQSQQQLQIDRKRLEQSENAYRIANLKQQAGLLPEVEVLRLEVDMETSRNTVAASEAQLSDREDAFKVLIGLPIEEDIEVFTELTYDPVDVNLDKALEEALDRRTELRTDEIDIELNTMSITETDAAREITGQLNLSYGIFKRDEDFYDAFQDFDQDRRVTFSLNVPLWDWSRNAYEVHAAEANLQNTRLTQRNRVDLIKQEVRAAVRNLTSAKLRVDITRRSQELAERSYRISLLRFENGDFSTQDLSLEQTRLSDAQRNYLNSVIDYKTALADLRRKTLWDFEQGERVLVEVPEE